MQGRYAIRHRPFFISCISVKEIKKYEDYSAWRTYTSSVKIRDFATFSSRRRLCHALPNIPFGVRHLFSACVILKKSPCVRTGEHIGIAPTRRGCFIGYKPSTMTLLAGANSICATHSIFLLRKNDMLPLATRVQPFHHLRWSPFPYTGKAFG